jgi:hypothetical protein
MQRSETETLFQALGATAEVMGTEIKPAALMLMVDDLADHPLDSVLAALKRCRREVSGRLTLAVIIDRINAADGFPGADEAWAIMSRPEGDTIVMTEQMGEAMQPARPLLADGDKIGARMAFKDAYTRIVADAREKRIKPKWFASLGHNKEGRAEPIAEAVRTGKLSLEHSLGLLSPDNQAQVLQLTGNVNHPFLLEHKQAQLEEQKPLDAAKGLKHIAALKSMLAVKAIPQAEEESMQ